MKIDRYCLNCFFYNKKQQFCTHEIEMENHGDCIRILTDIVKRESYDCIGYMNRAEKALEKVRKLKSMVKMLNEMLDNETN